MKRISFITTLMLICQVLFSCEAKTNVNKSESLDIDLQETKLQSETIMSYDESGTKSSDDNEIINVKFKLGKSKEYNNKVVEDTAKLKKEGKTHSVKYYSYINDYSYLSQSELVERTFVYYDVGNNKRMMKVNDLIPKNNYKWSDPEGVMSKKPPIGHKMSYGIDISKHNGNIDFKKVKAAGFDFVFIRIAYRGYGSAGNLKIDEMQETYLKDARAAGLKVGAYVFSQSVNESEAVEEAKLAIDLLKNYKLDLPLVYDPETIKGDIARTDNVTGIEFTRNTIAFCEEVKKAGFTPAIYSNMVWEDYYYDLNKLKDYDIWYADYNNLPQTPYNFKFWQFSEVGIVDGISGEVDLNVMIE